MIKRNQVLINLSQIIFIVSFFMNILHKESQDCTQKWRSKWQQYCICRCNNGSDVTRPTTSWQNSIRTSAKDWRGDGDVDPEVLGSCNSDIRAFNQEGQLYSCRSKAYLLHGEQRAARLKLTQRVLINPNVKLATKRWKTRQLSDSIKS